MAAQDYEAIADRADALLLGLLLHSSLGANSEDMNAKVKGLQPALNAKLHEEYPGLAPWGVRIAGATPVPSLRIPLSILLEMVDQGFKVGMWTVDYDGSDHLQRRDEGYLRTQRGDDVAR